MIDRSKGKNKQSTQDKPTMMAEGARSFDHISQQNMAILDEVAHDHGCTCQPYQDWFTYQRWSAQGFQVQKGEHGTRLTVFVSKKIEEDGKEKVVSFPRVTTVFCRCQVQPQ